MDVQDLFVHIRAGDVASVEAYLQEKPGIHMAYNAHGTTPLHIAVRSKQPAIARRLIELGAHVDATTVVGDTPLLNSVWIDGNAEAVELLLAHGADTCARDDRGCTVLFYARESTMVQMLIDHGAEVNVANKLNETPLHCHSGPHDMSAVHILLDADANPNAVDGKGKTPLHMTTSHPPLFFDRPGVVRLAQEATELLLKSGADPNLKDSSGWTPLHYSAHFGRIALVKILIANGADTRARTDRGFLPEELCMRAIAEGWGDATDVLQQHRTGI